nr:hypothetical protein [Abalone asfa-like virus]
MDQIFRTAKLQPGSNSFIYAIRFQRQVNIIEIDVSNSKTTLIFDESLNLLDPANPVATVLYFVPIEFLQKSVELLSFNDIPEINILYRDVLPENINKISWPMSKIRILGKIQSLTHLAINTEMCYLNIFTPHPDLAVYKKP